ncbi:interleukin-20 receptor subunit alpha-like isoform X2 [Micropterus salmoides]|uniref:interleukin-20 receptor subunit alpha-like isoform X2 n=1 Tax=Micropterus salmoides TaxID=27706 RepID=UPI0018EAC33F|nr:interleukin-20 receptor subunit alpha-like isoform X2 [Micropterus salmoides]
MNSLPLVLYLLYLFDSAQIASHVHTVLSSLPAPVNVSVDSVNFRHVLRWDPGPGTPPGTQYMIIRRVKGKNGKPLPHNVTQTSLKLRLHHFKTYYLMVQASYNQTLSPESSKVVFTPFEDTKIGPPQLSLTGCGNCIQINISLPEADGQSGIPDIQELYDADFRVSWRKHNATVESFKTKDRNLTIENLQYGMEYCVQVHTEAYLNKNTMPSDWKCTFTSIVERSRGPLVVGSVAALLMLVVGVLMTSMFCLYYTGLLCKQKLHRALIMTQYRDNILTTERIIPDPISISSESDKRRKHNNPTLPQPATRGANAEGEGEEEGTHVYMDRPQQLSSGESSCRDSVYVAGKSGPGAPGDSVLTMEAEVPDAEFEVKVTHVALDQDEAKGEGAEVSIPGVVQGHVIDTVEEEEEGKEEVEVCDSSGNINLFSVTLAALAVCEKKEKEVENTEDSLTEFLKPSNQEPLLPTGLKWTLSHTDFPTESDDQTSVPLMLPTQEDFTGFEGRRADTLSDWCDD